VLLRLCQTSLGTLSYPILQSNLVPVRHLGQFRREVPQTSLRGRDCGPFTKLDDGGHRITASHLPQLQRGLHRDFTTNGRDRMRKARGGGWATQKNDVGQIAANANCNGQQHVVRLDPIYKAFVQQPFVLGIVGLQRQ
jgi:hypothetical protein